MQQPALDPSLSVVMVSWNAKELLRNCLRSIDLNAGQLTFEVIVVDNASTDGSQEMVRTEFLSTWLIENAENVGFARAHKQALPLCSGRYIMLLNSDTQVLPGALHDMIGFMDQHAEVGISGPTLLEPEGTLHECCLC